MTDVWVDEWRDGREYLENRDGLLWADAPLPRRWHRCRAQSRGFMLGDFVQRCACGAISLDGSYWMERNARRRST